MIINTASGDIASFVDGADNRQIRKIVGTIVTPEGGSGWSECKIKRSGKNLLNLNDPTAWVAGETNRYYYNFTDVDALAHLSYTEINPSISLSGCYLGWAVESGNIMAGYIWMMYSGSFGGASADYINKTRSGSQSGKICRYLSLLVPNGMTLEQVLTNIANKWNIQVEYGTVTTAYEGYKPITAVDVDWSTEAGTILNGTVTLNEDGSADVVNSDTEYTYHLTDVGSLSTVYGVNNVWIDTGSITECDYSADTKLYIDGITAPDEDMIANDVIASGKYFVVNNQLYLSTTAIAKGAQIIPGTNCTATNLAEALNAINA